MTKTLDLANMCIALAENSVKGEKPTRSPQEYTFSDKNLIIFVIKTGGLGRVATITDKDDLVYKAYTVEDPHTNLISDREVDVEVYKSGEWERKIEELYGGLK